MTWVVVDSDGNESEEIDDEDEAEEQKRNMEMFGKDVELREVDDANESDDEPQGDDVDAEVIEMSREDGGNSTDTDDGKLPEPRPEIKGYRGGVVYCRKCDAFSKQEHRCNLCGTDLAGEPVHRGDQL